MIRFCKDCKHQLDFDKCGAVPRSGTAKLGPSAVARLLVSGEQGEESYYTCWFHRYDDWLMARIQGTCGRSGRFWEPKE